MRKKISSYQKMYDMFTIGTENKRVVIVEKTDHLAIFVYFLKNKYNTFPDETYNAIPCLSELVFMLRETAGEIAGSWFNENTSKRRQGKAKKELSELLTYIDKLKTDKRFDSEIF